MVKSVRLACLMCAASVYPEPGSNSHVYCIYIFKYKSKLIFILVFSSWVLTLWITFFHLVVLITTAWFLKDIVYFSMYFFVLNLLVGTLFILAQQAWFVNTFLTFFIYFFVSIFCFSCRNCSVFYHHFFKLSTCFFNFFKNFFST